MIIKRTFVCKMHDDYGMLGLVLKGHPGFEPLQGLTCTHDILEHFPEDTGELHEEFLAFGAMLYGRGEGGYFNRGRYTIAENMAADFFSIINYAMQHNKVLIDCPGRVHAPNGYYFDCEDFEKLGRKAILDELGDSLDMFDQISTKPKIRRFVHQACRWICRGFYKAKVRYRNQSSYLITEMFREYEKKIDNILKNIIEGTEVEVTIDFTNEVVSVEEVFDFEEVEA